MATTVTKPQSLDRLETQILDWQKRLKELMSDLERAATRQKQVTEKRDALVLDAVAGNNAQARKQLEKVREELREAEREREELDLAVRKVEEKLKDLERGHRNAAQKMKERKRTELSVRQLEIAEQLDQHLGKVARLGSEWLDLTLKIYQANHDLNQTTGSTPRSMFSDALATYFKPLVSHFIERPSLRGTFKDFSGRYIKNGKEK